MAGIMSQRHNRNRQKIVIYPQRQLIMVTHPCNFKFAVLRTYYGGSYLMLPFSGCSSTGKMESMVIFSQVGSKLYCLCKHWVPYWL